MERDVYGHVYRDRVFRDFDGNVLDGDDGLEDEFVAKDATADANAVLKDADRRIEGDD